MKKKPVFWQPILEIGVFIFTIFPQFPNQNSSRNGELKILKFPEIPQMGKNWGQALLCSLTYVSRVDMIANVM